MSAQTHLPVAEYYLAALVKMVGRFDEVKFRLLFAIFPLLAIVSFYRLARRFTVNPLMASSLFAVSPAFFVLTPTLMMDIPMLALLLAGISIHLDGVHNHARLWPSSICFILAAGIGYTVLIPLGCLFIWAVVNKRPKREWIAIAAAPACIFVWLFVMKLHFGQSPATELARYYTSHFSFTQVLVPMFSFIGGVALFPWIFLAWIETSTRRLIAMLSILAALLLTFFWNWSSIPYRLWWVFLASSGIGFLILFAINATRRMSVQRPLGYGFLILWLPMTLLFFLLFAEMMSARYVLLSLPPLLLVACNEIRRTTGICAVVVTMILSVALAIGDYRFVSSYPDWVAQNIVSLQQQGFRVWNAAESGLRFYLEKTGIETLEDSDIRPRGGDLIVRQKSFSYGLSNDLAPLLISIRRMDLLDNYPVRTFSRDAGAGFHDSHFGVVPFIVSRAPLDRLEIAQVSPFVMELPQVVPDDFSSVPIWFPGGVLLKQLEPEMKFEVRIPRDTKVQYELEGQGSAALFQESIVLKKENPGAAVWKNFRIVPKTWPE